MEPLSLATQAAAAVALPPPELPGMLLDEIRWASLRKTLPAGYGMTRWAAENGDAAAMTRAFTEEKGWDPQTTYAAAINGHEACLRAALAAGAPWDPRTTYCAAFFGRARILRVVAELGLPWDPNTLDMAYNSGDAETRECAYAAVRAARARRLQQH